MARRKRWRRYRGWIALLALLVVGSVALVVVRGRAAEEEAGPQYTTEEVATGTLSVTVSGTGNLEVLDEVEVYPGTSGTVAKMKVDEGDKVEAGDVLFTIDDDTASENKIQALASLRQAQEGVAKAKLSVEQAENELDALEEKADDPTQDVSDAQIDAAESQIDVAEVGVTSAKASLSSAELAYEQATGAFDELTVRAPCDGIVWTVNVAADDSVSEKSGSSSSSSASGGSSGGSDASGASASGGSSSSSSAPVVIARDGELAVNLTVSEADVSSVKKGQSAEITFDAITDLTISGKVESVSNKGTVSSGVVTYEVWVTLDVTDKRLKTGMSSTAVIVTEVVRDALLVANSAIKTDSDGGEYVQVLDSGSATPRTQTVTSGPSNATKTVVTAGLKAGDPVVTQTIGTSADSSSSSSGSRSGSGGGFMLGGPPMGGRD